jgi:hypothetical protein
MREIGCEIDQACVVTIGTSPIYAFRESLKASAGVKPEMTVVVWAITGARTNGNEPDHAPDRPGLRRQ